MGKRFRLLWEFMKGYRLLYLGSVLFVGLSALISMLSPLVMSFTLDNVLGDKEAVLPPYIDRLVTVLGGVDNLKRNLWICGLTLLVITIVNGAFQFLRGK